MMVVVRLEIEKKEYLFRNHGLGKLCFYGMDFNRGDEVDSICKVRKQDSFTSWFSVWVFYALS